MATFALSRDRKASLLSKFLVSELEVLNFAQKDEMLSEIPTLNRPMIDILLEAFGFHWEVSDSLIIL